MITKEQVVALYLQKLVRLVPKDQVWFKLWLSSARGLAGRSNLSDPTDIIMSYAERYSVLDHLSDWYLNGIDIRPNGFHPEIIIQLRLTMLESGLWLDFTAEPTIIE